MDTLRELLPLIWPLIVIQLGLMIFALIDLSRRTATRGPKWVWAVVIIVVNIIGPIVYFVVGREE
ncbi:MAG: PLDc N-terminal domain-containing protein [Ardenticatenaceae bacterium]|nr:PLDc N-terminal domain-containing protein [Ardenticatenaceae bacterium]MCB9444988.1 PLDc N-terminal domain-containing protein [Ardenticatenaceae bacterium]